MIFFSDRIDTFARLGKILKTRDDNVYTSRVDAAIREQHARNAWFIPAFINHALDAIAAMLDEKELEKLRGYYPFLEEESPVKEIAVISPGNIPLVGFHDFFSVLITGNTYIGKLSRRDNVLLPLIAGILSEIAPSFEKQIVFTEKLSRFDKIIATGSNNTTRYFDYYFDKYPHIWRHNRNSVAVLTGEETDEEMRGLYHDIFLYFGLGCRSVSKLFLPEGYSFDRLIQCFEELGAEVAIHHHYLNNLDYQKTMHLMNRYPFTDAGIALLVENSALASPIGIVHYQYYNRIEEVRREIEQEQQNIQCVVARAGVDLPHLLFGYAQQPALLDFADGVDTITWANN